MSSLVIETPVPLESYAAVVAALGAGLPLGRALDLAAVRPADWDAASNRWQAAIDDSAASDLAVLVAFDAALLAAKRRFEPTVEPIESDARAWATFRRHFVTAVDPAAFVAEKGLSLSVYARMEADWVNKLAADEALAAAFARHTEAPLDECPALTLTPSALLRAGEGRSPARAGEAAASSVPVAASPSVPVGPGPSVPIAASPSVPVATSPSVPVGPGLSVPFSAVPEVPAAAVLRPAAPAAPPSNVAITAKPAQAEAPALGTTGELPRDLIAKIARGPLPFAKSQAGSPAAGEPPSAPPAATAPPGKTPSAPPPAAAPSPKAPPAPAALSETGALPADLMLQIAKGTLPFAKSKAPAGAAGTETPPAEGPATSPVPKLPAAGKELPFHAPAAPQQAAPTGTPVDKPAASPGPPVRSPAASVPELTLDQYASMCAELHVFPDRPEAVFAKYGLTDPRPRAAVDAAWKERLNRHPSERAEWEKRYWQYESGWRRSRR